MYDLIEWFTSCKPVSISQGIYSFELFISPMEVLIKFCVFADEKLPKLKNKKYADYKFESEERKMLDLIQEVLAVSLDLPHIAYLVNFT